MATPSYPQEDNQEKTSLPCCKTLSLEGRWRNQISATLQGSTLGSLDHPAMPTGGGCNLHCDIVTCVWIFATAKRWSKKKTQCKFPLYETDDVEIDILFLGGGTWNSLVRFHHPTIREHQWHQRWPKAPWESSFERIQVHFYPRQSHLRSCATFCHVFRVFAVAEDRSWITTPTPLGKCTFFFEPK